MNAFSLVFLGALAANALLRLSLNARQGRAVRAHRDRVPPAFAEAISPEKHCLAADYTCARLRLARIEVLVGTALAIAWTLGGGLDALARAVFAGLGDGLAGDVALVLATGALMSLLDLPFGLWRTFRIEQHFGFNRTSLGLYFVDLARGALIGLVLGTPLVALVLWLMGAAGGLWWLYAWIVWIVFTLLLTWIYPVLIAPLFNRFEPLEDPALARRVTALLERNGFAARGVHVMDGSRRSSHGNAYFTGFGRAKRVVFFDTLLEKLNPEEIEAVLAHEIGHFRRHHIAKQLATSALLALAGLYLLSVLAASDWFYAGLGVRVHTDGVALLLFFLCLPAFTFVLQPLGAWLTRRHEFEADAFAARESAAPTLTGALVKLYRDNAATLTPDPYYSAFHDSHPPAPVRIAALERLEAAAAGVRDTAPGAA